MVRERTRELSDFFDVLFGDQKGYVRFSCLDFNKRMFQRFLELPHGLGEIDAIIAANKNLTDCYFSVNPYAVPGKGDKKYVNERISRVHADLDGCDPGGLLIEPSILVESSPGKFQAQWLLDEEHPQAIVEEINARLAYYHHIDKCWDAGHLMRVPGSINHKPEYDKPEVKIVKLSNVRYSLSDFTSKYPEPAPAAFQFLNQPVPDPEELADAQSIMDLYAYPNGLPKSFPDRWQKTPDKDWSRGIWHVIGMSKDAGMSPEETFSVARSCGSNKYRRDGRSDDEVWRDVLKSYAAQGTTEKAPSNWDAPLPLSRNVELPPFPVYVYPQWLRDMVTSNAEFTQTDVAMPGTVALAALSSCATGRLKVEVRPGWSEPANLFLGVVARSGERKTPVSGAFTKALFNAESVLIKEVGNEIAEKKAMLAIAIAAAAKAQKDAAKDTGNEELRQKAMEQSLLADMIEIPPTPRILADDVTPEALASVMAAHGGRLSIISDEGGIFDMLAGRYTSMPSLDVFLKSYSGSSMRVDRKGNSKPEMMDNPALTMMLMFQPSVLRAVGGNDRFQGRGLIARFFFVLPKSSVGNRNVRPRPVPSPVTETYNEMVVNLALTLAKWDDPIVLVPTSDALEALLDFAQSIEGQLGDGGQLDHVADWCNKLVGATARIAALLHISKDSENYRNPIEFSTMADAIQLAEFFIAHFLAATEAMGADPELEQAKYVLGMIRRMGNEQVTVRDIFNRVTKRDFPKVEILLNVLNLLEEHGWLRQAPQVARTGPGRRPSPSYQVNPQVWSAHSADSAEILE